MGAKPFHTKLQTEVYHNNNECTERNNIELHNKVSGPGKLRLCYRCKELNAKKGKDK